jgi:hypothetical protein
MHSQSGADSDDVNGVMAIVMMMMMMMIVLVMVIIDSETLGQVGWLCQC